MLSLYLITNMINHKFYIGVSKNPIQRFGEHKRGQGSVVLHRAIRRYGEENFRFEILFTDTRNFILEIEKDLVCQEVVDSGMCYNMACGGGMPPLVSVVSSAKSATTRKRLIAEGKIKPPPVITSESQKKGGATRKKMYDEGRLFVPTTTPESQKKGGVTRKELHAAGLINLAPKRDDEIYVWEHKDGRVVERKRSVMEVEFGLPSGNITNLLKGRAKTCCGWRIVK